jgi:hypothetical protein
LLGCPHPTGGSSSGRFIHLAQWGGSHSRVSNQNL